MRPEYHSVLQILREADDVSIRGMGLSLLEALSKSNYLELRQELTVGDLLRVIFDHPELVRHWVMYSEDRRTDGGWYLDEGTRSIGAVETLAEELTFASIEEAVAEYAIRELDFWASVGAAQPLHAADASASHQICIREFAACLVRS